MQKFKFLVSLAGTYEYVQDGSLRVLRADRNKDAEGCPGGSEGKGEGQLTRGAQRSLVSGSGQGGGAVFLKKKGSSFSLVGENEMF